MGKLEKLQRAQFGPNGWSWVVSCILWVRNGRCGSRVEGGGRGGWPARRKWAWVSHPMLCSAKMHTCYFALAELHISVFCKVAHLLCRLASCSAKLRLHISTLQSFTRLKSCIFDLQTHMQTLYKVEHLLCSIFKQEDIQFSRKRKTCFADLHMSADVHIFFCEVTYLQSFTLS